MKRLIIKTLDNQTLQCSEDLVLNFYQFEDNFCLEKLMSNRILNIQLSGSTVCLVTSNIISIQIMKNQRLDHVI